MAIASGNKTYIGTVPNATTYTHSAHSQDTGSGGFMVVVVASVADFGQTISGVTWNGTSMTQMQQDTISSDGQNTRLAFFKLANPATGTHDLVTTWSSSMLYGVSIQIFSFTGAQDGGNSLLGTPSNTPNIQTMSMTTNSIILGLAISRYTLSTIELPQGTARTFLTNTQIYLAQVASAISPSLNLSGTQTFEVNSNSNQVSLSLVEIKEGVVLTNRRIIII